MRHFRERQCTRRSADRKVVTDRRDVEHFSEISRDQTRGGAGAEIVVLREQTTRAAVKSAATSHQTKFDRIRRDRDTKARRGSAAAERGNADTAPVRAYTMTRVRGDEEEEDGREKKRGEPGVRSRFYHTSTRSGRRRYTTVTAAGMAVRFNHEIVYTRRSSVRLPPPRPRLGERPRNSTYARV